MPDVLVKGLTVKEREALGALARRQHTTMRALLLGLVRKLLSGEADETEGDRLLGADVATLYARLEDHQAVQLVREAGRALEWVRYWRKTGRWSREAEDYLEERARRAAAEREQQWADDDAARGELDNYTRSRAFRVEGRVIAGEQDDGIAFPAGGGWIPLAEAPGLARWLEAQHAASVQTSAESPDA
jgi:hypothetical protein